MKTNHIFLLSTFLFIISITDSFSQKREKWMSNARMDKALKELKSPIEGEQGNWQVIKDGRLVFILTDEASNRMRIFTPVVEEKDVGFGELEKMLTANFHSALDAKYSMYEGFVISIFTHPLKELTEAQLLDALQQVITLADTFGTTFSSTNLIFGGEEQETVSEKEERTEE